MTTPRIISDNPDKIVVRQQTQPTVVRETTTERVAVSTTGTEGPAGPQGPQGLPGPPGQVVIDGTLAYEHVQNTVASEWVVQHNLGFHPNVYAFDSAGSEVDGEVRHLDKNSLVLSFMVNGQPSAFAGGAYLS